MTPQSSSYRTIPLSQGQHTIVDSSIYEDLNSFKWYAWWNTTTRTFYAVRWSVPSEGRKRHVYMHRYILGLDAGDPRQGDHRDPSLTLDNRLSNLRIATPSQNASNRRKQSNNTSGFKGMCWYPAYGKWMAQINLNRKNHCLGYYSTPELAYKAYCEAAVRMHGEFARLE